MPSYRPLLYLFVFSPVAWGQSIPDRLDWVADAEANPLCGGYYLAPALPEAGPEIEARADSSSYDGTDRIVLKGNAALWNEQISLEADDISLFRVSGDGDAIGDVALREPRFLVRGDSASLNLYTGRVELYQSQIVAHSLHLFGSADSVTRDGAGVLRIRDALYTKCAPGQNEWQLGSDYMKLDRNTGRGFARNVTLRAKGVPVFWFPVIGFPVDERRLTGFLFPTLKQESNSDDGTDLSFEAPFYWNQAPQADMLIVPRKVAFRGEALDIEQRYLFDNESHAELRLGWLPDDAKAAKDREAAEFNWASKAGQPTLYSLSASYADDQNYDDDVAGLVSIEDDDFPALRANISHRAEDYAAQAKLYSYTVANDTTALSARPYQELPRLGVQTQRFYGDANIDIDAELVRFERDVTGLSGDAAVLGSRASSSVTAALPARRSWGFAEARLGADVVTYQLNRSAGDVRSESPSAFAPRASLDLGLNIARDYGQRTHRIEPRIKYLKAGYHSGQTEQPNFDTGSIGFSFTQLFSEQRFSGGDRIGDTEQVALGVSNKLLRNEDGSERIRVDFGQLFYLADRRVNLTDTVDTAKRSPLVSEARVALGENFSGNAETTLRSDMGIDSGALGLKYRDSDDQLATIRARFSDDTVTTYEASALYGINERWRIGGGFAFSRPLDRTQRFAWGFEYESCCWRASLVQSYDQPDTSTTGGTHAVTLQIQLIGLGMIGRKAITNLEDNIEDFKPRPLRF